jgi:hypothetical protein
MLSPVCPICKHSVTKIESAFANKIVAPPKVSYDATIAGYLYGPPRHYAPKIPYDEQPDLPGFVTHEDTDCILTREDWTATGREEVPPVPYLSARDLASVYTRTRSQLSKYRDVDP